MRAIPASLMPSTMTWRPPEDPKTGMGGEYGEEQVTAPVRFEEQRPRATGGSMPQYERYENPGGTIWVDARNSVGGIPPVGSLVSVDGGREMVVKAVKPYYGRAGELHHTEIEVS